jgi:hypothetical protein
MYLSLLKPNPMKRLFYFLLLLLFHQGFGQSADRVNLQLKNLTAVHKQISSKLINLKKEQASSSMKMEKMDSSYNSLLINLDSITGISIDLENKKLKSKAEEQKLIRIKNNRIH